MRGNHSFQFEIRFFCKFPPAECGLHQAVGLHQFTLFVGPVVPELLNFIRLSGQRARNYTLEMQQLQLGSVTANVCSTHVVVYVTFRHARWPAGSYAILRRNVAGGHVSLPQRANCSRNPGTHALPRHQGLAVQLLTSLPPRANHSSNSCTHPSPRHLGKLPRVFGNHGQGRGLAAQLLVNLPPRANLSRNPCTHPLPRHLGKRARVFGIQGNGWALAAQLLASLPPRANRSCNQCPHPLPRHLGKQACAFGNQGQDRDLATQLLASLPPRANRSRTRCHDIWANGRVSLATRARVAPSRSWPAP